jgi:hypothetical protein
MQLMINYDDLMKKKEVLVVAEKDYHFAHNIAAGSLHEFLAGFRQNYNEPSRYISNRSGFVLNHPDIFTEFTFNKDAIIIDFMESDDPFRDCRDYHVLQMVVTPDILNSPNLFESGKAYAEMYNKAARTAVKEKEETAADQLRLKKLQELEILKKELGID